MSMKRQMLGFLPLLALNESLVAGLTSGERKKSPAYRRPYIIPNGHRKFIVEGKEIYALSMRNAIKKYKKNEPTTSH